MLWSGEYRERPTVQPSPGWAVQATERDTRFAIIYLIDSLQEIANGETPEWHGDGLMDDVEYFTWESLEGLKLERDVAFGAGFDLDIPPRPDVT
jgi:hypothetical protein